MAKKKTSESVIKIKDVKKFTAPLKAMSSAINSVVFSKHDDDTFKINAQADDGSKKINLKYDSEVVEITADNGIDKVGIYNLQEFLSVISLFDGQKAEKITVIDNKMIIWLNDKSKINYILSDLSLIEEGPEELKAKLNFTLSFDIGEGFIKKVISIANSLNVNILRFDVKDNVLSYSICDVGGNAHDYNEVLAEDCDADDISISIPIKVGDNKIDNLSALLDTDYNVSLHPRVAVFVSNSEDYDFLRYYLAPCSED